MRELRFRAWDTVTKKWVSLSVASLLITGGDRSVELHSDRLELMQYTGLKDKNGVEIYEGDIVRILYTDWMSKDDNDPRTLEEYLRDIALVRLVEWNYNGFYVCRQPNSWHETMEHGTHGYIEVIGNIYENPELLDSVKKA